MRHAVGMLCGLALLFAAGLAGPARAQQEARAAVMGRVLDPQGAAVPNAEVVVRSDDTGVEQKVRTSVQGNWAVRFLIPGHYGIRISAEGFVPVERRDIELQTSDQKQFDVKLELGSTTTHIEVVAETPLVDTTAATSGTVITKEEIAEMPSMSRVTTVMATLSPGVLQMDQNQNIAHLWSFNAASQLSGNGGVTTASSSSKNSDSTVYRSNDYQIDGMPNIKSGGQVAFMPAPEAVQEFRVVMNAYDASLGRQAGTTIQMTTKSGTAKLRGSLYEYNQNNFLNANLFQSNLTGEPKAVVHYNEYGGTAGGPVWIPKLYDGRQRTFFFFNYNGIRNQDPRFTIRSLPVEAERKGDFSQTFTTNVVGGQRVRYPVQVYDPASVDAKGYRTLFPGMVIPATRLSKVAQAILAYVPLPNTPGDGTSTDANNFVPRSKRVNKMADVTVRGDHIWNNSHKSFATVRWYHEDELTNNYFEGPFTGQYQHRMTRGAGVDHVWTLDPSTLLNFRANITRYEEPNNDNGVGFDPTTLGMPKSYAAAQAVPVTPRITGVFGDIGNNQAGSVNNTSYYTWSAVLTHIKGNMTFKYGAEYWVLQQANKSISHQGRFDFGSEWTRLQNNVGGGTGNGSTLASFMLGLPHNSNSSFPRNADAFWSQRFTALYFQNDWRATNKLTLNFGLRWDYETPVTERYNRVTSVYDANMVSPISPAVQAAWAKVVSGNPSDAAVQTLAKIIPPDSFRLLGGQRFNGVEGVPEAVVPTRWIRFQPRVGFAYRLGANTVIRGGFGIFAPASFTTAGQNGFSRSTALSATRDNFMTPYDTLDNPFRDGILNPTGSSLGPLTNLGQGPTWFSQDPQTTFSRQYSIHIQRQWHSWLFEAGYTRNFVTGVAMVRNRNMTDFNLWKQYRTAVFDANGRPADQLMWDVQVPNPFRGLPEVSGSIATNQQMSFNQLLNPVKILGGITQQGNLEGTSRYDAMVAKVERRFKRGFSVINAFTWSKQLENTTFLGPEIAQRVEHRLGGQDRPLRLSVAPIWEIPVGRNRALWGGMPKVLNAVLGGWQLSGQFTIQSGAPVTFDDTDSFFFSGEEFSLPRGERTLPVWFDTSQFYRFPDKGMDQATLAKYPAWTGVQSLPGYGYKPAANDSIKNGVYQSFGTYIRTIPTRWAHVRSSRVNNVDSVISKSFSIREQVRLQYRFEVYNLFNHVRFGEPNADPTSSSFGKVNPAQQNNARLVQMALKLYF